MTLSPELVAAIEAYGMASADVGYWNCRGSRPEYVVTCTEARATLEAEIARAVAAEREACAKICADLQEALWFDDNDRACGCGECHGAILSRAATQEASRG